MAHFHGDIVGSHLHGNGSPPVAAEPNAPTSVTGSPTSGTTATITWVDASGNETGFDVEIESPAGSGVWVAAAGATNPTAAGVQTFAATGLSPITAYTPRVRGFNGIGVGAWTVGTAFTTDNTGSGGGAIEPGATPLTDTEMRELLDGVRENNRMMRIILAGISGKTAGLGTSTETYYGEDGSTPRIVASFDGQGNRAAVTTDGAL